MDRINILDYSPIFEGSNAREALLHTKNLAQLADSLGYYRYWVAEHHQVFSVAGSTPEMLMMQLAASTSRIRIGSGGVMLPHYSAYKVAEYFRMLEAFHPDRIDLGIGRSPSFRLVNKALNEAREKRLPYEQQVADLYKYLTDDTKEEHRFKDLAATPVIETVPQIWVLGRGMGSAKLAAANGSAYAYAHFAPGWNSDGKEIIQEYRRNFKPNSIQNEPEVMVAVFAIIAETTEEAENIAQAFNLWLLAVESGGQPPYYPSVETAKERGRSIVEEEQVRKNRSRVIIGNPKQVKAGIEEVADKYQADEVTIIPHFYDAENRMKGITLLAEELGLPGLRSLGFER
ncbi:LLM class flavin-dependent oxidoreductase [Evansella clarkii]|uniref:LLM class flavin-dependent oxidoreductase n=1 Tax=Evansella clarkii TaxID=79879 RepID=UPI00099815B1|nr:LLM class flavin-dependent oxidoreductase [Evansella clarkii]